MVTTNARPTIFQTTSRARSLRFPEFNQRHCRQRDTRRRYSSSVAGRTLRDARWIAANQNHRRTAITSLRNILRRWESAVARTIYFRCGRSEHAILAVIDERMAKEFWPNRGCNRPRFTSTDDTNIRSKWSASRNFKGRKFFDNNDPFYFAPLSAALHFAHHAANSRDGSAGGADNSGNSSGAIGGANNAGVRRPDDDAIAERNNGMFLFNLARASRRRLEFWTGAGDNRILRSRVVFGDATHSRNRDSNGAWRTPCRSAENDLLQKVLVIIGIGLVIGAGLGLAVGRLIGGLLIGIGGKRSGRHRSRRVDARIHRDGGEFCSGVASVASGSDRGAAARITFSRARNLLQEVHFEIVTTKILL